MSEEAKHTDGSWECWNDARDEDEDEENREDGEWVVGTGPLKHSNTDLRPYSYTPVAERMTEADARLIAAAPELLAAAERARKLIEAIGHLVEFPGGVAVGETLDDLEFAISKAKGTAQS